MSPEILVIDDEKDICEVLTELFKNSNYSVISAYDAEIASSLLEKSSPPLIVCDITMPGRSGLEFLEYIREKNIPAAVVMLTAHSESDVIIEALQLGAIDYVVKPFESEQILARAPGWLEIGKRLQNLAKTEPDSPDRLAKQLRMIELFRLKNRRTTKEAA